MSRITLLFGLALIVTGVGFYLGTGQQSVTALIPSFIGLVLAILAAVSTRGERARKHAMHGVAVLCLVSLVPTFKGVTAVFGGSTAAPAVARSLTFLLCLLLLILCVNSFIQVRRRRRAQAGA